jgi:Ca2+-transporting ATPase
VLTSLPLLLFQIILCIAAVISLALGLYQDLGTAPETVYNAATGQEQEVPSVDWVEGVAIMVAVLIVVMVGSVNDVRLSLSLLWLAPY